MASKYVAAQAFADFKEGDAVTVDQVGDNASAWLADGKIREREAAGGVSGDTPPVSDPEMAQAENLMIAPPSSVGAAPGASYVTLASGVDGMPRFTTVVGKREPEG